VTSALPLTGVTVVELGHSVAAPFAGSILAQLGARVVKVEPPGAGDPTRDWGPPYRDGVAVVFEAMNRDKEGVAVNLKDDSQKGALRRFIVDQADVVIQNLRPGSIERLGLAAADLLPEKPSLVYCNLSAFGQTGPLRSRPGYDPLMQAYGGLMSISGEPGRPPVRSGVSIIDMGAGMWSVIAILAALRERDGTGRGGVVDTSLYETALAWMTLPLTGYLASGEIPKPLGSAAAQIVPYQIFEAADGYLMVAAGNDNLFCKLARALGREDWCDDERYRTNGHRVLNRESLIDEISGLMRQAPVETWISRLDAAGVPNARPQTVEAVAADPQTLALNILQQEVEGRRTLVGLPVSFDGVRPPMRRAPPALGAQDDLLAAYAASAA
jgi:crotonobetainyl-CoA:carnitine CoA-transferase CaiB-like acyl-CoA transferase